MAESQDVVKAGKIIFIITGGELGGREFFRLKLAEKVPEAVICADGGARHLEMVGRIPDLVVGDMDSIDLGTLRRYEELGCRIVRHARRKNETDTELALQEALALEPREVWIWGALGKRLDHTLANLSLLSRGLKQAVLIKLVDQWCEVFMIAREAVLEGEKGQTVSLLPVTPKVTGVALSGFEYPLKNSEMEMGYPYGVSNRLIENRGLIEIGSGLLLAIRYFQPDVFPEGEER
ncbi:MAG: thiamine diphosphokinase [Syntrophobacterales bacterium]|nr:thiamine diphosphokinase [Syntrophobacterales bacterium]